MSIERGERAAVDYICAACGGFGTVEIESLDSGTTLTHDACEGKTIVLLMTVDAYTRAVQAAASRATGRRCRSGGTP